MPVSESTLVDICGSGTRGQTPAPVGKPVLASIYRVGQSAGRHGMDGIDVSRQVPQRSGNKGGRYVHPRRQPLDVFRIEIYPHAINLVM